MTVKEHDIINFSVKIDFGAQRYYGKEVLCEGNELIINTNDGKIPLHQAFHIEVVGTSKQVKEMGEK